MTFLTALVKPLAYLSLPAFAIHALANANPAIRYYVRIGLFLSTLGVCSVWGVICSIGMGLVGRRFDVFYVIARSFYYLTSPAIGVRLVVEGEEYLDTRPSVLVGNHQSMFDILYLGRIFPKRASILAKKELQWTPFLGQFMTFAGAVFVDRGNNARAVRSLTAAGEVLKERNSSLWLFPEGTRSLRPDAYMRPFKKGAFHTAIQAQVPIVPVVCENYWRVYRKGYFAQSATLKVKVLPPIPTIGMTAADASALADRVHDLMVETLREISVPPPPGTVPEPSKPAVTATPLANPDVAADTPTPAPAPAPVPVAEPEKAAEQVRTESRASTSASEHSSTSSPTLSHSRVEGSEYGTETEEDDGMVLVGRPSH
ncbi:1-acylglycerol-3-phosphate O [Trametes versicolor FP-101664 SS1]|uniref:1-acylglycerol-3-phosphate O n=1 Tax=Trametes versicolor (strain FP-101664) TaxID=717944 RepID=UPI0004621236|nr:1-acylglycerol-3-phosphate O [Trametes versicolor FP-101664 SS1]EIW61586.1 1-acylglycerol-3-phosphate O [Trametes versicolor FP-101664 SS1]